MNVCLGFLYSIEIHVEYCKAQSAIVSVPFANVFVEHAQACPVLTGRSSNGFAFSVLLVSYPEVAFSALSLGQAEEKSCENRRAAMLRICWVHPRCHWAYILLISCCELLPQSCLNLPFFNMLAR